MELGGSCSGGSVLRLAVHTDQCSGISAQQRDPLVHCYDWSYEAVREGMYHIYGKMHRRW